MRLINCKTLKVEEFGPGIIPPYAILSHTWGDYEPTLAEWRSMVTRRSKSSKPGFAKIFATCKQARRNNHSHVWIDTVCIDKTSSAELSEAINSMFAWYKNAVDCYVYLSDIPSQSPNGIHVLDLMGSSRWFSRGWTLQELIAPDRVVFYSQSWTRLGSKKELSSLLSSVTGIDQLCIRNERVLREYSIAQRMSWAADRVTTRPEDIAYCLLGLFGINMPLLYGEGEKAFIRLQEEILRQSDDHSILAFDTLSSTNSLLANHPNHFRDTRDLRPSLHSTITPPFAMTNAGLTMETPLIQTLSPHLVLAVLNCDGVETKKGLRKSQACLPLLGKNGIYMRARAPFCLIKKNLSEMNIPGNRIEIEDLTTPVKTKYLVSYFTRVYPAFAYELDLTFNGFDEEVMQNPGFLLTFPRGMGHFQLVEAFPPESLQRGISFFNPPVIGSGQAFAHGLLIFQDMSTSGEGEPTRIGLYLAQAIDDMGGDLGGQWMCALARISDDFNLYEKCKESWQFENPDDWGHYDHVGTFLVAARTNFTLQEPACKAVMVEMVFDADILTQEQGLDTAAFRSGDWISGHGGINGRSLNEVV